ncbi:acetyltransferase [Acinetobacter defluvii]|uniref:acetyltransferase n=1 Tax=Acinetobacter defluvii TaxID=1871111 RepID=UPI00148F8937|nr:acetyltransferase [Acinetobacter defluvii]
MKDLIIVGAGGHGVEIAWLAKRCQRKIKGFLDSTPEKQNTQIMGLDVLGPIEKAQQFIECEFIIAIGNPRSRKKILDLFFNDEKFVFATLVDPQAVVGENVIIAEGSMICVGAVLTVNVNIGQHCIVNINSTLSHGVHLENFVTIAPNASLSGDVILKDYVEIGANAVVKEKLVVREGAMIGMGAVLTKDVEKNHVMVGNPAKLLKIID